MSKKGKQQRTALTLKQKIEILDKIDACQKPGDIAKEYDIHRSTISKLVLKKRELRERLSKAVHAICGTAVGGEEGYGAPIVCALCGQV